MAFFMMSMGQASPRYIMESAQESLATLLPAEPNHTDIVIVHVYHHNIRHVEGICLHVRQIPNIDTILRMANLL